MSSFPERDISSHTDIDGFTETKKYKVLACGNILGNANKFYCLEIQYNPTTGCYRLFCHRGRIGSSSAYGVREELDGHKIKAMHEIEREFDKIIASKLRGKKKQGKDGDKYAEAYEEVELTSPNVGSSNIRKTLSTSQTVKTPAINVSAFEPAVQAVLTQVAEENIHNILATTSLKLTGRGLSTPLGPLSLSQVAQARQLLTELERNTAIELMNRYFSLIPRQMKRTKALTDADFVREFELLDQLEAAVTYADDTDKKVSLGFKMRLIDPTPISRWFEDSRASNHGQLRGWKVRQVFAVERDKDNAFPQKLIEVGGNPIKVWHGSKNCNILSILMNGLIIPPHSCPTYLWQNLLWAERIILATLLAESHPRAITVLGQKRLRRDYITTN